MSDPDETLRHAAEVLLAAASNYLKAANREMGPRGVVWLSDHSGALVVMTRGELADELKRFIDGFGNTATTLHFVDENEVG